MQLEIFQVDAFSSEPFGGNPAAVIPLQQWLPDDLLQRIAEENNLSETAYFVRNGEAFDLRWFTPPSKSTCVAMRRWLPPGCCSSSWVSRPKCCVSIPVAVNSG